MPKLHLKIDAGFTVKSLKIAAAEVAKQLNDVDPFAAPRAINLCLMIEGQMVGFGIGRSEIVAGSIAATAAGETVKIDCQGVFVIDVRPQYVPVFLDPKSTWRITGITYRVEDKYWIAPMDKALKGLTEDQDSTYNEYLKITETRTHFRVAVQTAKKAKDLNSAVV